MAWSPSSPARAALAAVALLALIAAGPATAQLTGARLDPAKVQELATSGRIDEALGLIEAFMLEEPQDYDALMLKGLVLTSGQRWDQARDTFVVMTGLFPKEPRPYNNLAVVQASAGRFDEAIRALRSALSLDPNYVSALENLGHIYATYATRAFERARSLDPDNTEIVRKHELLRRLSLAEPRQATPPPASIASAAAAGTADAGRPEGEGPPAFDASRGFDEAVASRRDAISRTAGDGSPGREEASEDTGAGATERVDEPSVDEPPGDAPTPAARSEPGEPPAAGTPAAEATSSTVAESTQETPTAEAPSAEREETQARVAGEGSATVFTLPEPSGAAEEPIGAVSVATGTPRTPDPEADGTPAYDREDEDEILGVVHSWAAAWSEQDFDAYLAFYGEGFENDEGRSRDLWERRREERITRPRSIEIGLANITVEPADGEHARVTFTQSYRSDTYRDVSRKRLLLRRADESWRIVREQSLSE